MKATVETARIVARIFAERQTLEQRMRDAGLLRR